ncbi:MAG: hypothetical protein LBD92_00540, partial [Oscillospiraceae bacterium]|nr:hypothetical protein [Oscillospiraceae bacterium]
MAGERQKRDGKHDGELNEADGEEARTRVAWHPAFNEAAKAELVDYLDMLTFEFERQLNSDPLRIDVLIIKKAPDVVIEKNIGAIFRRSNIVEYKSPSDTLSVDD